MEHLDAIKASAEDINNSFGRALTTIEGWVGALAVSYFSPGAVCSTILGMCVVDLVTGTMLSLKIGRWIASDRTPKEFPELAAVVAEGKKTPFTWKKWGLWAEKMAVVFVLVIGCEWFKLYLLKPGYAEGTRVAEFSIWMIYFVIIFTNFRSSVRNTALVSENRVLLSVWLWMGGNSGIPTLNKFLSSPNPPPAGSIPVPTESEKTNGTPG